MLSPPLDVNASGAENLESLPTCTEHMRGRWMTVSGHQGSFIILRGLFSVGEVCLVPRRKTYREKQRAPWKLSSGGAL